MEMGTKRFTYNEVIARIDDALSREYYLEATWIAYSLFEDRCNSMLLKTGGMPPVGSAPFVSINKKINILKQRASSHPYLQSIAELESTLDEIWDWKEDRNPLMHSMVDLPRSWESINLDAKVLAEAGRELLGRFSAIAMRVRKKYVKDGNS